MDFSLNPLQDSESFPDLRNAPGEPVRLETINSNESTDATDHYET